LRKNACHEAISRLCYAMMHGMFNWDDARYFLAIHRAGTLSAAGRQLRVNQSTVGRRLELLEAELSVRLFLRTRDGYTLAPAGEQLLPRAERMEDEAHAIGRELVGQQAPLSGTVRVTSTDAFGPRVVAPILAEFHAAYPAVRIELDPDNRLMDLARREADLSVRFARPAERHLVARKLVDFANAAYCAPSYIARRGRPTPPFDGHDFVVDTHEGLPEGRWALARAARGRVVARTPSTHVQATLAAAGMGIALLPCYFGDEDPGLVRLAPPDTSVQRTVWLVMHKDLQHATRIRACADFLADRIRAQRDRIMGVGAGKRGHGARPGRRSGR
jgi:DNA-binding transcriptional LysR family regulator